MEKNKIAVLGLGYVGLPLAVEFSKHFKTIGFDVNLEKVEAIQSGNDPTNEIGDDALNKALKNGFVASDDTEKIKDCNIYIVTVPTDIYPDKTPNLEPLQSASETIGKVLKRGDLVIYESTTYPGCTEEFCVPILEKTSALKLNADFGVGYSPERINPGDKERNVTNIVKVTSGSSEAVASKVDELYQTIVNAGTHLAPSIKVAEASKAIENAQRDINISFMNELALIFDKLNINTQDVLKAANTKWNFLPFTPGLVGGHCIGVDPYYLAYKAQQVGHTPKVILSGREINDSMGLFVAGKIIQQMTTQKIPVEGSRVLLLGFAFKPNSGDTRNTRVYDVYKELIKFGVLVSVYDPLVDPGMMEKEFGITPVQNWNEQPFDFYVETVAHSVFGVVKVEVSPDRFMCLF